MAPVRVVLPVVLLVGIGCTGAAPGQPGPSDGQQVDQLAVACAAVAVEYRAALDDASRCDPGAAAPCVAHGALVRVLQREDGTEVIEGLCTSCPAAVNPARTADLDAVVARYEALGCSGACPCPLGRDETWTPACAPTGDGAGVCGG